MGKDCKKCVKIGFVGSAIINRDFRFFAVINWFLCIWSLFCTHLTLCFFFENPEFVTFALIKTLGLSETRFRGPVGLHIKKERQTKCLYVEIGDQTGFMWLLFGGGWKRKHFIIFFFCLGASSYPSHLAITGQEAVKSTEVAQDLLQGFPNNQSCQCLHSTHHYRVRTISFYIWWFYSKRYMYLFQTAVIFPVWFCTRGD